MLCAYIKTHPTVHVPIREGIYKIKLALLDTNGDKNTYEDKTTARPVAPTQATPRVAAGSYAAAASSAVATPPTVAPPLTVAQPPAAATTEASREATNAQQAAQTEWQRAPGPARGRKNRKRTAPGGSAPATAEPATTAAAQKGRDQGRAPEGKRSPAGPRNEAIAVRTGSLSSAELVRAIRKGVTSPEATADVSRIRLTRSGEVLFEMKKGSQKTQELLTAIKTTIGEDSQARRLVPMTRVTLRDLDGGVVAEEAVEAIRASVPDASDVKVVSMRPAFGGTQTAVAVLSRTAAVALVTSGTIRIGWTNCRVRILPRHERCYRCRGTGHIAAMCKDPCDRSKECFRCGLEGHKAATCTGSKAAGEQQKPATTQSSACSKSTSTPAEPRRT